MSYQKIKPRKISDVILEELEQLIVEGSFAPGQKLPPERELAKQFDVSRPSLREAIQKLEAKGLVTRKQGGGTFVNKGWQQGLSDPLMSLLASHDESQYDLLEFRHALEGISAYYAALRGTENDFQHIEKQFNAITDAQQQQDVQAEAQAVQQFYMAVAEASHNVVLLHLVRGLSQLLQENVEQNLRTLAQRPETVTQLNDHRRNLLNAIIQGDPANAREACHEHLAYIEQALLASDRENNRVQRSIRRMLRNESSEPKSD